jgi:hypothetical protein
MLDYRYNTISPFIKDKTRLFALSSGYHYGNLSLDDEHLAKKMDSFIQALDNPEVYQTYERLRNRDFPDLNRRKSLGSYSVKSDILLNDNFRQNNMIEEIYRRGLCSLGDIRKLSDEITRRSVASSRGYERDLVLFLNNLDAESINRKSIKPIIV